MSEQWIFDDVGIEHNDIVGKKCANLGEMRRAGIPVPPGFALSIEAYKKFMTETGTDVEIRSSLAGFHADPDKPANLVEFDEVSKSIRRIVESREMPEEMRSVIARYYQDLCEKCFVKDVPVATRSAGIASHPGQFETYLYVQGISNLLQNIKKVWASTFNPRSMIARARLGLPLESDPIGVAVIRMVDAKAAGVMFTLNPVNGDVSKISIGGSWGLGEAVVSGEVTNDQWVMDKVTLEIIDRMIASKACECIVDRSSGRVANREISLERRSRPCLTDEELLELAKQGKRIEKHFGVPQDIEWAIDGNLPFPGNVFFVQARPETIWSRKEGKSLLETSSRFGEYDIFSLVKKA
ncbi:MAG: phenylphosphate synthase subunit beta [Desulfobacteraceae bacterium]|nr:MAG: phenylphosphate synthase subunit beta [Desulfobacteraceae bacterium]